MTDKETEDKIRDAFVKHWKDEHCNMLAMSKPDAIFNFKAGYLSALAQLDKGVEEG